MRKIALVFFLLCNAVLTAQDTVAVPQDTVVFTHGMNTVDIIGYIRIMQNGTRRDVTDSTIQRLYPAGTLSDLLGSGGSVALKSVGPGALSTVAVRGANSMQTPVLWNGINLQNINNNTVDLSLIPVFLFDGISVEPGSSSAAWGSGAVGGVIRVNSWSRPHIANASATTPYVRFRIVNEAGSFGTFMNGVQLGYGKRRWNYDLKAYRQTAQNDFTFTNLGLANHPLDTLAHAHVLQQGMMANIIYGSPETRHSFAVRSWVQETSREIPPTMVQTTNEAVQRDYAFRTVMQWSYHNSYGWSLSSNVGIIHEGLLWDGGFTSPLSNTNAWTVIGDVATSKYLQFRRKKFFNNVRLTTGITGNWASSEVTEFIVHHEQTRFGVYASYDKFLRKNDEFNIMIREEIIDGRPVRPVGSIWYSLFIRDMINIKACVSHNYRVPTFNDLYWAPGGNRDLKAETGWTEELTVAFALSKQKWTLNYSVTVYNRNVVNMITWVPHASYWSPVNVAEVWSKGIEHRLRVVQHIGKHSRLILVANADYVRSTYEKTDDPDDVALGKQLIYVPAWFGSATLTAEWKDFFVTYSQQYNDLRFTTRDHLEWLPAYSIGNAAIGWSTKRTRRPHTYIVNVFLRCNNIADVQYQSVAWRPMPGRGFTLGLSIDFAGTLLKNAQ
jgi:iron complex outermembrane receptor protein